MNPYLAAAGCLAIVVGLIHSVLGEVLIFRRMRRGGIVPTDGRPVLKEPHVRILWATWHLATVFGWGLGAILLHLSAASSEGAVKTFTVNATALSMLAASVIVLVGTRGKHPGWLGLLGVALLLWMG